MPENVERRPRRVGARSAPALAAEGRPQIHRVKAEFFRAIGHPVRVRILELLRDGERSVGDLQAALTIDSSGTSQHLGALRKQGLLESRREGTSVYYRVKDPRTFQLLEVARQILTGHFEDHQAILGELSRTEPSSPRGKDGK
ncbi:MAG: metalloregulator ArsR/SmtB family transcription factor [Solirubrobacterales bacterium]|nr:metalloregulator ArsR/SmtB family transcription factor [Solirubrobacterales bacterium]